MSVPKIHVIMAAAECSPFAKVGGLADVVGSLPQSIAKHRVKVSVVLPKYGSIKPKFKLKKIPGAFITTNDERPDTFFIYKGKLPNNPVDYYFIDHKYFHSKNVYVHGRRRKKKE